MAALDGVAPDMNPTGVVDLSFATYVAKRKSENAKHLQGEVPDYGFALDHSMRQRLAQMGPIRSVAQIIVSANAPMWRQLHQMYSLMVGPEQFTDIYALGEQCARRLGIGIPRIFIAPIDEPNAFTISTNDVEPMVILTRRLVQILTEEELLFVIGHECGHIHNFHGIYNTSAVMLVNPTMRVALEKLLRVGTPLGVVRMVASAVQGSLRLFLLNWSRCAEITADRAGLICCGDLKAAERALLKLIVGDEELLDRMNVEAYVEQVGQPQQLSMGARIRDMENSHPLVPQRIKALRIFAVTDAFLSWRPDVMGYDVHYSKIEADLQCGQLMGVLS